MPDNGRMEIVLELPERPGVPAYQRLADAFREGILTGRFRPGERVPPSRQLAKSLSLARNTILEAYEQLLAEGYLLAHHGSGTYVAPTLPDSAFRAVPPSGSTGPASSRAVLRVSEFGRRVVTGEAPIQMRREESAALYDFRYGTPSLSEFPMQEWRTLTKRVLDYPPAELLGYGPTEGLPRLREALARYLQRSRGVRCVPEQVIIVNGSQQALDLATRVTVEPGDTVVMEEPGYPGARAVFAANGGKVISSRCDGEGIVVDELPGAARLAYVTPSHQFPTGAVLSASRRLELLSWARRANAIIVEDDYDSEFRYEGHPLGALQGLDDDGRVVYTGTLSKVLLPALRLGYLVAPESLQPAIAGAKWLTDRHVALLYQAVLALFIEEGYFDRHLRRMRKVYERRRNVLLEALDNAFGSRCQVTGTQSGIHVLVRIEGITDGPEFVRLAHRRGVGIALADAYYAAAPPAGAGFIVGYSSIDESKIAEGVWALSQVSMG
jgi:GntR family transcriptional regulator/MocR family aminotransferase